MSRLRNVATGIFPQGIPYARFGNGPRTLLMLAGGPGNDAPRGLSFTMYSKPAVPVGDEYTVWIVTRRIGQPPGFTTRAMAGDVARVIAEEFGGRVDAVIGMSMGGMIAQYLAADHPGCADRLVLLSTAYRGDPRAAELDRQFAAHLAAGRHGRAYAAVMGYLYPPGVRRMFLSVLMRAMSPILAEKHHEHFASDVLVEAEACRLHDAEADLGSVRDPVVVIGGDADLCFPKDLQEKTAALIPGSRLILYPGRGHANAASHPSYPSDLRGFLVG
ncbi:MAG: alpha/beta fold hydrolase [Spirochaetota bacterium]